MIFCLHIIYFQYHFFLNLFILYLTYSCPYSYNLMETNSLHMPVLHPSFSPILEFPPGKMGIYSNFPPENLVYTRFFPGKKLVYTQFSPHGKSGMRIHILTFPPYWFFPLMKLKFYSINMHLIINFSIPCILIIHKWSFNISNKTIYAELIESLYSDRS